MPVKFLQTIVWFWLILSYLITTVKGSNPDEYRIGWKRDPPKSMNQNVMSFVVWSSHDAVAGLPRSS